MNQETRAIKRQTEEFFREMGIENPDLSYITDEVLADSEDEAIHFSETLVRTQEGFNLMWETDRLVWNYVCGLPSRAYALRENVISLTATDRACNGYLIYVIETRG